MPKTKRTIINSSAEIPTSFASEDDEREWWATHDFSDAYLDAAQHDPFMVIANLELQLIRLSSKFDKLTDENRGLRERLEKLEARLTA